MDKELREIAKASDEQGWRYEVSSRGHVIFYPPDKTKRPIVFAGTPSDHRSRKNSLADMKRAGFVWPWHGRREK